MTTEQVLASDAERADVASIVQTAGGEGRLTITETEERLARVYAARYRHELAELTRDLPRPVAVAPPWGWLAFAVHAGIVLLVSTLVIVRWVYSGAPFFWPVFPMTFLAVSLLIHLAVRARLDGGRRLVSR
ncbi:DUF1707 domain-containing protein [Actinocrispum sp. NPDC049592]|uniref:DUF1707 SHOCT-like domain-containing protein n=1 Tax=Actinocrispum sp. NPDC049592 TaxID=3154835 RepID=UPI00343BCD12